MTEHDDQPSDADRIPEAATDLHACDREPIHVPGAVQPHGLLLVLEEPDLTIRQISANAPDLVGRAVADVLGHDVSELVGVEGKAEVARWSERGSAHEDAIELTAAGRRWTAVLHRSDAGLVVELEPSVAVADTALFLHGAMARLEKAESIHALCDSVAREVRRLTGLDRVKVYEFDRDWHGHVVAEARAEHMDAYLGLHFPATDIPAQARRLYTLNRTRLIADAGYTPVPVVPAVNPQTGAPLDMTHSVLRSVSPVHVEYLNNMDVGASMSVSILVEGRLWGLIACHHATACFVPHRTRVACSLLAQMLALLLVGQRETEDRVHLAAIKATQARLLEAMMRTEEFVHGLSVSGSDLLDLVAATGAVIYEGGVRAAFGEVPDEAALHDLAAWLVPRLREGPVATSALSAQYPAGEAFQDIGSGLLAVSLSRLRPVYLLWFRPELPQTVTWAGAPRKAVQIEDDGVRRLHPRQSFRAWKERVRGRAKPWRASEVDAALDLTGAIVDVVFAQAERVRRLNTELARANRELQDFAYVASHDLQEPLRKVQAFADLLQREHLGSLNEEARFYVDRMQNAAARMGTLILDLLALSRVGTRGDAFEQVDLTAAARRSLEPLDVRREETGGTIEIDPLPTIEADPTQIELLFQNLIGNALKYHREGVPPVVRVTAEFVTEDGLPMCRLRVADNGIGFDERYLDRIFTPFQRLHGREAFTGTGMGLAICRRIVQRHAGTITARSVPGEGSTFIVTLPIEHPIRLDAL